MRELLVKQRTQLINALRGHACEFGVISAKGTANAGKLVERVEADATLPAPAREMFVVLGREIARLDEALRNIDCKLAVQHKDNPLSQLLVEVPGIGPIGALTLALTVDATQFKSGRHFAAWCCPARNASARRAASIGAVPHTVLGTNAGRVSGR